MQAAAPTPSSLDDDALLRRIRAGDRDAFTDLMRRYNRRLYRVARSVLRDDAEAEDALQDAYLQAYRALPAFRGESALGTWLTRIVVNAALMRQRKTGRLADVIELGADFGSDDAAAPRPANERLDQPAQPELAALRAQTRRLIETGIDKLPAAFRTVFVLRAVEELTVEETAATLDIPEATVRTRYFRARAMLREALAREIDFAIEDAFGFDGARCDRIVEAVRRRLDGEPSA
ncbi:RNA polymerase sigma-70 factor, ECF subfamily [Massilia sp. PDC64]|nr:RNA polymerase sigma factor [Massilia sp. PDC64]SDC19601.1 RNA polymerase sigma-70 factor, ECF subfamily [Massilia sp. PDC64]